MRIAVVLPLALVLALLLVVPAAAAPPVTETGSFDEDDILSSQPCPGIMVRYHTVGAYRSISFFDNAGNLIRTQFHATSFDELYNGANPDLKVSGHANYSTSYDVVSDDGAFVGTYWNLTAPGYGPVYKLSGRLDLSTGRMVGIDTTGDPEALAALCAVLAGD